MRAAMQGIEVRELAGDEADDVIRSSGWGYLDPDNTYRPAAEASTDVGNDEDFAPQMLGRLIIGLLLAVLGGVVVLAKIS